MSYTFERIHMNEVVYVTIPRQVPQANYIFVRIMVRISKLELGSDKLVVENTAKL